MPNALSVYARRFTPAMLTIRFQWDDYACEVDVPSVTLRHAFPITEIRERFEQALRGTPYESRLLTVNWSSVLQEAWRA